jgi:dUTP pyrophosphatase
MSRVRGFEIIAGYQDRGISLPIRKTCASAGYDIAAVENVCLRAGEMALIPTGLKAYMQQDEYLAIHIRSSLAVKQRLVLANSQGIIDADYYNNADNEGHILIALLNGGSQDVVVSAGMRIAQGIFCKYLLTDQDESTGKEERTGGIGSTGTL